MQFAKIAYNRVPLRTCARWLRTGLDLRKNQTNRAFQALKTLLAYSLLPSFQAPSCRHHRDGNSIISNFPTGRRGLLGSVAGAAALGLGGAARAQKPLVLS